MAAERTEPAATASAHTILTSNQRGGTAEGSELVRELTGRELLRLADRDDAHMVSIYLATSRNSSRKEQQIAWAKLIRSAERQLMTDGVGGSDARRLLAPTRRIIDNRDAQAQGIVCFASAGFSSALSVAIDVPTTAVVASRCYLRPLLPLLESSPRYYVLRLSRGDVRFFAGSREFVRELSLDGLPLAPLASMPPERRPAGGLVADRSCAGIHGGWQRIAGRADELDEQQILVHFREVDAAVTTILENSDAPLVLAGVGYLHALYRGINSYPALMPEGVIDELESMTTAQLHQRAWPLVEEALHGVQREVSLRFTRLNGTGRTVRALSATARAANNDRVESLLVATGERLRSGSATTVDVSAQEPIENWMLIEQAIAGTLRHGGSVHLMDVATMPTSTAVAGILRHCA